MSKYQQQYTQCHFDHPENLALSYKTLLLSSETKETLINITIEHYEYTLAVSNNCTIWKSDEEVHSTLTN